MYHSDKMRHLCQRNRATTKDRNQGEGNARWGDDGSRYEQDIASSGAMSGTPFISAWVVGQKVAAGVAHEKVVGDGQREYGRMRAATFGSLVDTANARLLNLRSVLTDRYSATSTDQLLDRLFSQSSQEGLC